MIKNHYKIFADPDDSHRERCFADPDILTQYKTDIQILVKIFNKIIQPKLVNLIQQLRSTSLNVLCQLL